MNEWNCIKNFVIWTIQEISSRWAWDGQGMYHAWDSLKLWVKKNMKGQAWRTQVYKCEDNNNIDFRTRNKMGEGFDMY